MPSRSVPFGVKPRTWSATSSPRKPSMGSPASNPYAPTPRACWIPAANTGVLKTVSTTFATSPLMKIARASAVAQAPRSWPPFAISPYRFSASPELATSPQHFAAVLVRAIPSSFASSGCDFDVAVARGRAKPCTRWFHLAVFTISYKKEGRKRILSGFEPRSSTVIRSIVPQLLRCPRVRAKRPRRVCSRWNSCASRRP